MGIPEENPTLPFRGLLGPLFIHACSSSNSRMFSASGNFSLKGSLHLSEKAYPCSELALSPIRNLRWFTPGALLACSEAWVFLGGDVRLG